MNNPCINGRDPEETVCPFVDQDKNDEPCLNCLAKLKYAVNQGMFSPEVLEQKDDPLVLEARKAAPEKKRILCKDCKRRPIKAKDRCNNCYGRMYYRKTHKTVRPYKKRGTLSE